jgi:hypothetical protein
MVYAVIDCAADDDVERTSVPKALWIVMIILLPVVGSLAWLAVTKIAKPKVRHASGPPRTLPQRTPRRPVAPDDNPEFLRRLAEEQARRERERRRQEPGDGGDKTQPESDQP